jgi:hypothetical protein
MTRNGSTNASCASAKATPCLRWFSASLRGSHSKLGLILQSIAYVWLGSHTAVWLCAGPNGDAGSAWPRGTRDPEQSLAFVRYRAISRAAHPSCFKTRVVDAGYLANAAAGRRGRSTSSPLQFGHLPPNKPSEHVTQNVHSNVQILASVESGGRSRLQHSQFGLSSSIGFSQSDHSIEPSGVQRAVRRSRLPSTDSWPYSIGMGSRRLPGIGRRHRTFRTPNPPIAAAT